MAVITTSGFVFDFRFVFYALDLVENGYNVERVRRTLFEIIGPKFENLKKFLMSYKNFLFANFGYLVAIVVLYRCAEF